MTNDQEFQAGTDPNDPNSLLRVKALGTATNGGFALEWQSVTGRTYQVLYTDALPGDWLTNLPESVVSAGVGATNLTYRDPAAGDTTNRLYRVRLLAP
jgi:hypothetical protein